MGISRLVKASKRGVRFKLEYSLTATAVAFLAVEVSEGIVLGGGAAQCFMALGGAMGSATFVIFNPT